MCILNQRPGLPEKIVKIIRSKSVRCNLTEKTIYDLRRKHDVSFSSGSALVIKNNGYVHRIHYWTEPFGNVIFGYPEGQTPHVYNVGGASAAATPVAHTAAAASEPTAAAHGAAAKAFTAAPEAAASTTEAAASIAEANIVTVVAKAAAATTAAAITSIISTEVWNIYKIEFKITAMISTNRK